MGKIWAILREERDFSRFSLEERGFWANILRGPRPAYLDTALPSQEEEEAWREFDGNVLARHGIPAAVRPSLESDTSTNTVFGLNSQPLISTGIFSYFHTCSSPIR